MSVPTAYMTSSKNVPAIFGAIREAGVPPRFTNEFLKSLGFTSSNDRAVIGVLKALGFLDQAAAPSERYRAFRNPKEAPYVLAAALREAYADLFLANENAQTLAADRIKGILATKTDKGDAVIDKMAVTFRTLVGVARWDAPTGNEPVKAKPDEQPPEKAAVVPVEVRESLAAQSGPATEFHYNIQIHLPATKDISVYNAIFKSLREHLL